MLLDVAHRRVDLGADVGRLGQRQQVVEARLGREVEDALGVVGGGFIDAAAAPGRGAGLLQLGALGGEADLGEAQEDQAEDGPEYSWALRPELARNWSAASQRRFSSVAVAVSFSEGAIQCMVSRPR